MSFGHTASRAAPFALALAMGLTACGGQSESEPTGSKNTRPADAAATESGSGLAAGLGDYSGLCAWASPSDLETIFGQPVDAVGFKECRVMVEGDSEAAGVYHLRLDDLVGIDQNMQFLKENQQADQNFMICDTESMRWKGMRIERRVTCPKGSGNGYQPVVSMEVDKGRVLTTQPFVTDSEQAAQDASQRFVEIFKAFATFGHGQPVINEVLPGSWLEIYNPSKRKVDLSGAVITGYDDWDDGLSDSIEMPSGSTIAAGGRLMVDIKGLKGLSGDMPMIQLSDADGRFLDVIDLSMVTQGEVARRNGDGGTYCSFGSSAVTKGAPNPPPVERCD